MRKRSAIGGPCVAMVCLHCTARHSLPEFLLVALAVTLTPGPATATIIRVAARDGRRTTLSAIVGNSAGVLAWGCLAAVGVSSLVLASTIAYDALRLDGAGVLVLLGLRSLLGRSDGDVAGDAVAGSRSGWRTGLVTSLSNPKLAIFFVALFPQFLEPGTAVLPAALAMAGCIVAFDLVWYSCLAYLVDRAGTLLRPRVHRGLEQLTGTVLVGLGIRLATLAR